MGVILQGQCECGFETENLFIGGGMRDMLNMLKMRNITRYLPAVCLNCNIFLVKNYNKKFSKCPKCRKKVFFYGDPQLENELQGGGPLPEWNMPEDYNFILSGTEYYCPQCREIKMKFIDVGCWD
jgi:ribosomal protein L37AE/L43A